MEIERLAQNINPLLEIRFSLYLTIERGNESGELLPLLFLDVVLESLENCIARILGQVSLTGVHGLAEIVLGEVSPRLSIGGVHGVVFRAHLVVEALVVGATLAIDGIRGAPVEIEHHA